MHLTTTTTTTLLPLLLLLLTSSSLSSPRPISEIMAPFPLLSKRIIVPHYFLRPRSPIGGGSSSIPTVATGSGSGSGSGFRPANPQVPYPNSRKPVDNQVDRQPQNLTPKVQPNPSSLQGDTVQLESISSGEQPQQQQDNSFYDSSQSNASPNPESIQGTGQQPPAGKPNQQPKSTEETPAKADPGSASPDIPADNRSSADGIVGGSDDTPKPPRRPNQAPKIGDGDDKKDDPCQESRSRRRPSSCSATTRSTRTDVYSAVSTTVAATSTTSAVGSGKARSVSAAGGSITMSTSSSVPVRVSTSPTTASGTAAATTAAAAAGGAGGRLGARVEVVVVLAVGAVGWVV